MVQDKIYFSRIFQLTIPPHTENYYTKQKCDEACTGKLNQSIYIVALNFHMHNLGKTHSDFKI